MNVVRPLAAETQTLRSGAEYLASIKEDGRRVLFETMKLEKDANVTPACEMSIP